MTRAGYSWQKGGSLGSFPRHTLSKENIPIAIENVTAYIEKWLKLKTILTINDTSKINRLKKKWQVCVRKYYLKKKATILTHVNDIHTKKGYHFAQTKLHPLPFTNKLLADNKRMCFSIDLTLPHISCVQVEMQWESGSCGELIPTLKNRTILE